MNIQVFLLLPRPLLVCYILIRHPALWRDMTRLLVPPESLVNLLLSGRAVFLVPSINELLLPLFTSSEVIGVESLFEGMPLIEMVVRDGVIALEHDTAIRVRERKWLPMALVIMLLPTFRQQSLGYAEILDVLVVIESFPQLNLVEAAVVSLEVRRADYLQTRLVESAYILRMREGFEIEVRDNSADLTHFGAECLSLMRKKT